MAEVNVELNLRLPKGRESEVGRIINEYTPDARMDESVYKRYGRLGDGIEETLRESANGPEWLDEQLTFGELLVPQFFDCEDGLAKVSYMVDHYETGEQLAQLMADVFTMAGIEVAGTYVIPETGIEEGANDDEEFAHLGDI